MTVSSSPSGLVTGGSARDSSNLANGCYPSAFGMTVAFDVRLE